MNAYGRLSNSTNGGNAPPIGGRAPREMAAVRYRFRDVWFNN